MSGTVVVTVTATGAALIGGPSIVTVGAVPNPTPGSVMLNLITPRPLVISCAVAAAPTPPPPVMVTVGVTVYPAPALVIKISFREVTPPLVVKTPTAVALSPI